MMDSQETRILNLLKGGPVCGGMLLTLRMPRYSARIAELRAKGHEIETVKCQHYGRTADFVLVQPSLF